MSDQLGWYVKIIGIEVVQVFHLHHRKDVYRFYAQLVRLYFLFSLSLKAYGCPVVVEAQDLQQFLGVSRASLKLFKLENQKWQPIAGQIDPRDEWGRFLFFGGNDWETQPLTTTDRLVTEPSFFGGVAATQTIPEFPCKAKKGVQLVIPHEDGPRKAFLFSCIQTKKEASEKVRNDDSALVRYLPTQHRVQSDVYDYSLKPKNHMLFERISMGTDRAKEYVSMAKDSDLMIFSNFKNFLTMSFTEDDLETYLDSYRIGPVAMVARITFYLKVLFFKVKLKLTTDVSFFRDSGHIPMILHLPKDAWEVVNPGSGLVYSWLSSGSTKIGAEQLPDFRPTLVLDQLAPTTNEQLARCKGRFCQYQITLKQDKGTAAMHFSIPRHLVARGFFPMFVENVAAKSNHKMGWGYDQKERQGFYFETSKMPRGEHSWDLWYAFRSSSEAKKPLECPIRPILKPL